ncbi:MAG: hypothetical protein L0G87_16135 [Renibacterium salmoninarum]|nr:hypothetical protein [Renibacterium salmoninarum]
MDAIPDRGRLEIFDRFFGFGWDSVLKWILLAVLSSWFWTGLYMRQSLPAGYGPIDFISEALGALGLSTPMWLSSFALWLEAPERHWLMIAFSLSSAVCILLIRSPKNGNGLYFMSALLLALAIQGSGGFLPAVWAVLALVAAALVAGLGAIGRRIAADQQFEGYNGRVILARLIENALALLVMPIIVPLVLVFECVRSYAVDMSEDDSSIVRDAVHSLKRDETLLSEMQVWQFAAILQSMVLTGRTSGPRWYLRYVVGLLSAPSGARGSSRFRSRS